MKERQQRSSGRGQVITADRLMFLICILGIVTVIALGSLSFAKYKMEGGSGSGFYEAETFCFESNLLAEESEEGTYPSYELQEGVDTITVVLKNYPDDLRFAQMDITYIVELMQGGEVIESEEGTLETKAGGSAPGKNDETVSFDGLEPGIYRVRAKSLAPYAVTLQGDFVLTGEDEALNWTLNDGKNSPDLLVTVTTKDYEGTAEISWPEGVYPDNTDAMLEDASGSRHQVELEAHSQYSFRFFKASPGTVYTRAGGEFSVEPR